MVKTLEFAGKKFPIRLCKPNVTPEELNDSPNDESENVRRLFVRVSVHVYSAVQERAPWQFDLPSINITAIHYFPRNLFFVAKFLGKNSPCRFS